MRFKNHFVHPSFSLSHVVPAVSHLIPAVENLIEEVDGEVVSKATKLVEAQIDLGKIVKDKAGELAPVIIRAALL